MNRNQARPTGLCFVDHALLYPVTTATLLYVDTVAFGDRVSNPHRHRQFRRKGLYSGIKSITVGPGPDQALRVEAVRQLLVRRTFHDVEVRQSAMTYRD